MRYFLVDKVLEFEANKLAVGIKNITLSDEILHDHFPDYPTMPGAMIIEAMAQLAGFLLEMSANKPNNIRRAVLAQIDQAKFYRMAEPGDQLKISVTIDQQFDDAAKLSAKVSVNGEKTARALLMFVTKNVESDALHQQRKNLYHLWTKHMKNPPEIL